MRRRQINTLPSKSCIREFSTGECATLSTTSINRTDMRNRYIPANSVTFLERSWNQTESNQEVKMNVRPPSPLEFGSNKIEQ